LEGDNGCLVKQIKRAGSIRGSCTSAVIGQVASLPKKGWKKLLNPVGKEVIKR